MKTCLKSLFLAVIVALFCIPMTASAKPHSNHSRGAHHQQMHHPRNHYAGWHHNAYHARQCGMTSSQFSRFASLVKNASFTKDKVAIVRDAAASNSFTVDQVINVLRRLSFDSEKVQVAAAMYDSVCDTNNWYLVYGEFTFSSKADELRRAIQ